MTSVSIDFRLTHQSEDEKLSLILTNAFLPLWNHNWLQSATSRLEPLQYSDDYKITKPLTARQKTRREFYWAFLRSVRPSGGDIHVVSVPRDGGGPSDIGAVLAWHPPKITKSSLLQELPGLYRSGLLELLLLWNYGLEGLKRVNAVNISEILAERGIKKSNCGSVHIVAINPRYAGKGYASMLLDWRMKKHFAEFPRVPVILDTSTERGVKTYSRLGFELLYERSIDTGTDAEGIRLKEDADESVKEEARSICKQRIMMKMPEDGKP